MAYSAIQIANEIIKKGSKQDLFFTQMQLLKLVYIAHGWHLAIKGEPLVDDEIQAWKYGPVIPNLYQSISRFGASQITEKILSGDIKLTEEGETILDFVIRNYGQYSAFKLSEITHAPCTPWSQTFNQGGGWAEKIPNNAIKQHYQDLYKQYFKKD